MLRIFFFFISLLCLPTLAQQAQRVISLAPHITEMAYAAGMGQQLIAASDYSDYPADAKRLPQVASWQGLNIERIVSLKPDLVLAWREGNPQRPLEMLQRLGIKVLYLDNHRIADIAANLELLAKYSAHPAQATAAASRFRLHLRQLQDQYRDLPVQRVFLQFGIQPLLTTSDKSIQSQIVALCRGENIFADSTIPWPQISREQVIKRRPTAIIISGDKTLAATTRDYWHKLLPVPVIALPESEFSRKGPRILQAADKLCQQLRQLTQEKKA